jgi:hypothetical protein
MIVMDLTDREIELLMAALGAHIGTLEQHPNAKTPQLAELITELFELETDLREALHRQDDGWGDPDDPDLLMDPVDFAAKHDTGVNHDRHIAETQMFNAGVEAREKMKATSRAAGRRALKFSSGEDGERSETQKVDVWAKPPNDPVDW